MKDFANLELEINASPKSPEISVNQMNLGFGELFTPHMLEVNYSDQYGWENAIIRPFENFSIHPANSTLHYALTCYEGKTF
jgi:branched-chain amino acid aminotransferase